MKRLLVLLLLFFSVEIYADNKSIYIVLSSNDEIYQQIATSITHELNDLHVLPEHVHVINMNDSAFTSISPNDLIVPIGDKAAAESLNYQNSNAIVYSFVEQQFIEESIDLPTTKQWAAAVVNQPIERLITTANNLVKDRYKNKIVILVSRNNLKLKRDLESIKPLTNGRIELVTVNPDDISIKEIEQSLFNAGALITTYEKSIWSGSNAKWLLHQAYSYQVPIIGHSKRFIKAGALLSVYSSLEQISATTSHLISQWTSNGELGRKLYYSEFQIGENKNVAQALNIDKNKINSLKAHQ